MRQFRLSSAALSFALTLVLMACGGGGNNFTSTGNNNPTTGGSNTGGNTGGGTGGTTGAVAGTGSGTAAADTISGRVLDAATNQPISGNVLVALESPSPADGKIVNETSPDAQGNFSFTNLATGSYIIAVTATNSKQAFYTPVLLGPSGPAFGNGKDLTTGTNVGVIPVSLASGSGSSAINVPVQSDKAITVTLTATINIGDHYMEFPWPQGIPTFDTSVQAGCSNGAACTTNTIQVPSAVALVAAYNGTSTKYSANAIGANFNLWAKSYTQNGAQPTCDPNIIGPVQVKVADGATEQVDPFKFTGCQ